MTYLIDIDDFENLADISNRVLTSKLKMEIGPTQQKYGLKLLCKTLYEQLVSQWADGGFAYLDTNLQNLYPYFKDFLVYKTYARYLVGRNIKDTPAGSRVHTDTISREANTNEMQELRKKAEGDAEFYEDELLNFLEDNKNDYPTWRDSACYKCKKDYTWSYRSMSAVGTVKPVDKNIIRWT